MSHFLLTPGKKLGKLPKICDALGSCCSRGTVFCRFGSWKKFTVCIWTQGIQKWSQKRIPCPPGAGKWAHLLSSTIIYDIVDMGRHLRTGQYFKTRSPRDPGVPKRGADTLAKMFSDLLDTGGGYSTHWGDSFLLLVNLEKIDIRSIMKRWNFNLCRQLLAALTSNRHENLAPGVFHDGEQLSLFEKARRWRLLKNRYMTSTSISIFVMKEVRGALFDDGFWKYDIFWVW